MTTFVFDDLAFTCKVDEGGIGEFSLGHVNKNVALDDGETLIPAVARAPFMYEGKTKLNVELFGQIWLDSITEKALSISTDRCENILCFVPGVCESAETWTVQHLARLCQGRQQNDGNEQSWNMAVLELEGHGLSTGQRAVLRPSGRPGLQRLVNQVVQFCRHITKLASSRTTSEINVVLAGMSLGGTIAAYAAPRVAAELQQMNNVKTDRADVNFDGCLLLSPAVGVAAEAIPPPVVVNALSCLAWLAPSCAILTPEEDPSHYACPSWSTRNFKGQWPLGTSKLLLDITIDIVPNDISSVVVKTTSTAAFDGSNLSFHLPDGLEPYKILVLAGQKDQIVPMASIRRFVDSINGKSTNSSDQVVSNYACTLVEIPKGDHGLLARNKGKSVDRTLVEVKKFLNSF